MTNPTLDLLNNHRSIRRFTEQALSQETIEALVKAAQMASTSSFVQAYSIIGVSDASKKKALRNISGQSYVEDNGHLFVFVADYYRHRVIAQDKQADFSVNIESTEGFIVATVDAALASQNLVVAAESMGLGTCYIGSLRNDMQQFIDILELPDYTYPLFGVVVGYPAQEGSKKTRLPFEEIYHDNTYHAEKEAMLQRLSAYDEELQTYYQSRQSAARQDDWTTQIAHKMRQPQRLDVGRIINQQGFLHND